MLPAGVEPVSLPPGGVVTTTQKGRKVITWDIGTLQPQGALGGQDISEGSFTAMAQPSLLPGGSAYGGLCKIEEQWIPGRNLVNILRVSGTPGVDQASPEPVSSKEACNTCVQPSPPPAILLEVVDLYDPIQIGDTTTYKITVTNQGKETVRHVNITAWVPEEMDMPGISGPKVRVLKSLTAPAPNKLPLHMGTGILDEFQCKPVLGGMLEARIRAMLWAALRTKLAQIQRAPEVLPQTELHQALEALVGEFLQDIIKLLEKPGNDKGPFCVQPFARVLPSLKLSHQIDNKTDELLWTILSAIRSERKLTHQAEPLMDSLKKLLPEGGPVGMAMTRSELEAKLPKMWPLYTWPLKDDEDLQKDHWVTFKPVNELRQHWRATYYVQVRAKKGLMSVLKS